MQKLSLLIILLVSCFGAAQVARLEGSQTQPAQIRNAKLETVSASGSLQQQISAFADGQSGVAWIGYAVPAVSGNRTICCFDGGWQAHGCCGTCRLESEHNTFSGSRDDCDDVETKSVTVLYRVEEKKVGSIRLFSENCAIDAGGVPVTIVTGADPKQSIAYLSTFVAKDSDRHLSKRALDAIAEHADASADTALDRFVAADYPQKIREHAAFWLGVARSPRIRNAEEADRIRSRRALPGQAHVPSQSEQGSRRGGRVNTCGQAGFKLACAWTGAVLARAAGGQESCRSNQRFHRKRSRNGCEEEGGLRAIAASRSRRCAKADRGSEEQQESGGKEAGGVLVGTIERSKGARFHYQCSDALRQRSTREQHARSSKFYFFFVILRPDVGRRTSRNVSDVRALSWLFGQ